MADKNILVLVEGAKTDVRLVQKLLRVYDLQASFKIIAYETNIYELYNKMFEGRDVEMLDLLQTLKEHDAENANVFDMRYSDILLIFDLDPQDHLFDAGKIKEMSNYFNESTDNGKLYLNYPMVEAFSHRYNVEDSDFMHRTIKVNEVKKYKQIVNEFTKDPSKLGVIASDMSKIIMQNLEKANNIMHNEEFTYYPDLIKVLDAQLDKMNSVNELFVLCTCIFFIVDYDKGLLE